MAIAIYPKPELQKLIEEKAKEENRPVSNYVISVLKKHLEEKQK